MLRPKVLIVDDQQGIAQFFQDFLSDQSFDISVAQSTKEALTVLGGKGADIVVADIGRVEEPQKLALAIRERSLPSIWASKFETIDLEDLPFIPRILNKPFKAVDLRTAIKSEFSKIKKRFDTI